MKQTTFYFLILFCVTLVFEANSQTMSKEQMIAFTSQWKGERFPDGRPKIPDSYLERAKNISIEEAWGAMREYNYFNQFEGKWMMLHEGEVMTGRALTAQYMPLRPDINDVIKEKGKKEGRIGATNSWPIDALSQGDIYVADGYGKITDGTLIGDNLGNAIFANSGNGVIFDGSVRDIEGLERIKGFNAYVRGWDPSYIKDMMLTGLNTPIRIGLTTVMPGDLVLAKREGVIFIPAHLVEQVITKAEFVALKDSFGHLMLKEGQYTPGEIDTKWTDKIKEDFLKWIDENPDKLPMSRAELDNYLKNRTW
ncbi:MAG: 4-hydroxy-4-methyl-2-oxoglutarate aldolase [Cyclobacteriaceae bacterium]|jgi:regulator of RNase E activity RraA